MAEGMRAYVRDLGVGHALLALKSVVAALVVVFVPLLLRNERASIPAILLVYALDVGVGAATVPLFRRFRVRRHLAIGTALYALGLLALAWLAYPWGPVAFAVLDGLTGGLFWVPLNHLCFRGLDKKRNGANSGVYFLIPAILAIGLPPLGALLAAAYGFPALFTLGGVLMLALLPVIAAYAPDETHERSPADALRAFKGLKSITFVEGALHYFRSAVIPVAALLFLSTEAEFGGFSAYLGAIALLASLWLSHRSDRDPRRMRMVAPLLVGMGAACAALGALRSAAPWLLVAGAYAALDTLSAPLRLAISLDRREHDMGFWAMREVFLNIGRCATLVLAALAIWAGSLALAFLLFTALMLGYVALARRKLAHAY